MDNYQSVFIGTNRYRMLREGREYINRLSEKFGAREKRIFINIDYHIIDQIINREFPSKVFEIIAGRFIKHHQEDIIELADMPDSERPHRINVYGDKPDSPFMVGLTINRAVNGNVYVNMRTCYKERNHGDRKRNVSVHKIRVKNGESDALCE